MGVTDDADDGNGAAYAVRHKCDSPRAHDAVLLRLHLVLHLWGVLRLQSARSQLGDLLRVWFVLRRPLSPGAERQRIRVLQRGWLGFTVNVRRSFEGGHGLGFTVNVRRSFEGGHFLGFGASLMENSRTHHVWTRDFPRSEAPCSARSRRKYVRWIGFEMKSNTSSGKWSAK